MFEVRSCATKRLYTSGGGTVYHPDRHQVIECPWVECARRVTGRPDLFVYRHKFSKGYMLAHWVCKPNSGEGPGYFLDLEDFPGHPDGGRFLSMAMVRARLRPLDEMRKNQEKTLARQAYEENLALEESERQRKDAARWLKHRYGSKMDKMAWSVEHGEHGYAGDMEAKSVKGIDIFGD